MLQNSNRTISYLLSKMKKINLLFNEHIPLSLDLGTLKLLNGRA
jgi:hypothetical protein